MPCKTSGRRSFIMSSTSLNPWSTSKALYRPNAFSMSAVGPGMTRQKISGTETTNPSAAQASASSFISSSIPKIAVIISMPGALPSPSGSLRYPVKVSLSRVV